MVAKVKSIIAHHKLTDTGVTLNGREHDRKVVGPDGQVMILKTDRIELYQPRLLLAAALQPGNRRFKAQKLFYPTTPTPKPDYLLLEYVEGKELKELYQEQFPRALAMSKAICADYQLLLQECQTNGTIPKHFDTEKAYGWMGRVFHRWIRNIIDRGLLTPAEAFQISSTLFQLADQNPQTFFGYTHGNIHGEHIIVDKHGQPYLLDLTVEPRPGGAFYDLLRALDFALLEHPDPQAALPGIIQELQALKAEYDPRAVQAVWAFRCIGLLGMDILNNKEKVQAADYPIREQIALAMIRGQY